MKKSIFTTIVLLLSYSIVFGQISTNEKPMSFFRTDIPALETNNMVARSFAQLDMQRIMQEDIEDEKLGIPPRFGYRFSVNYNLENSGEWITLRDGGRLWRLVISSPGALSINLLYDKFWIPDGAKFWIYSSDHSHSIGAFTSFNNIGDRYNVRGFATDLIFSDQITLEYYLPSDVSDMGVISISYVVHGYRNIRTSIPGFGQSDDCHVNVNCLEGQNWQREKNAVALMIVGERIGCTGFLINNTAGDGRPLFMTAHHCLRRGNLLIYDVYIPGLRTNLDNWLFLWHYESATCENPTVEPVRHSTGGGRLIASNENSDFALFDLSGNNSDPRNHPNVSPYFLGWDRSGNPGTGGVGIHHPFGDIKKISTYTVTPQSANREAFLAPNGYFWSVNWIQTVSGHGITEDGSSGSPLINSDRRVIGQLLGGTSDCAFYYY